MSKKQKAPLTFIYQDNYPLKIANDNMKGYEIIKYISKNLPHKPGVYQMENEKGDILYIINHYKYCYC